MECAISVGVATRLCACWRNEESAFASWQKLGTFSIFKASRPAIGPSQPHIHCVVGTRFPGKRRLGSEAHHLWLPSTGATNAWSSAFSPPQAFMTCYAAKH